MIYFILSIITSVIVVSYFKLFDIYKVNTFQAIVVNYFTCAVMGNLMTDTPGITTNFWVEEWFGYTLLIGFLFISVFYSIGKTAQKFGHANHNYHFKYMLINLVHSKVHKEGRKLKKWRHKTSRICSRRN